ncbi:hypothetical protein HDG34_004362 [Paraburkholderia sp. HC6.4b]|nr:hypothetical protein [Paraburkholderia sp. HC6.4b]MBB5452791.1 hypothetical protein [Paraburkholderia sp. Kb1A]
MVNYRCGGQSFGCTSIQPHAPSNRKCTEDAQQHKVANQPIAASSVGAEAMFNMALLL